jgi:hypothetical protein
VVALGLFASIYQLCGDPFWPTSPVIYPHGAVDGTSLMLPFAVTDRSAVFGMPKVSFTCGIDLVLAADSIGQTVLLRDFAFVSDTYTVPSGSNTTVL